MDYNWEYNNCHIFVEIITKQLYYNFNILFKEKIMLPNTKKYKKKVQEHDQNVIKIKKLEEEITNNVFDDYIDKEKRDNLLKSAQTLNYSNKKVSQLQKVFDNYNQDIFTYNIALDIIDMQSHVKEHQKEGFLSKIANIIM